jgi:hypothetical protein
MKKEKKLLSLHGKRNETMIRKLILLAFCAVGLAAETCAQAFDNHFEDRTLRLDYVFGGNNKEQHIFFEQAYSTTRWAGRRSRLTDMPLKGNGQIRLKDSATGELLYIHTFSTLFQEWQTTEEATKVQKAFETSYNVPFPKHPVEVTVTLTNFHGQVVGELTHTVDPKDILIRTMGDTAIPYRYVWKPDSVPDLANCIDLAIVAEGYTAAQTDKFFKDCQRAVDALFSHEPFTTLKKRFNVVAVAPESLDDGTSVPREGRWRRTPAYTHYDTFYSNRYLMTQDVHRLYDLLSGVPFEHIIVLVNSSIYGGGGIYNQLLVSTSNHPTFSQVLVHEFGHSYAGLGDEYFYDDVYETQYPADTEPWEPNLTTKVDFQSKWADLLPDPSGRLGLYEGGGYQSKGVWRPSKDCRMKTNESPDFCPVCSRAIVRITDFYTCH